METVLASQVPVPELGILDNTISQLPEGSPLAEALIRLAKNVRDGRDTVYMSSDVDLTPAQAAELLRMSRPHLYKLLDAGGIAFHRVGRDRRISLNDLQAFISKREAARCELAETFAQADENRRTLVARLAGLDVESAQRAGL